jgi:hypothetical protein
MSNDQENEERLEARREAYNDRIEGKRERFDDLAEKSRTQSAEKFNEAHDMASVIPFGQPILIGHHSEKRDRNYRARYCKKYDQSHELSNKADHYEQKSQRIGTGGIASDDPDAVTKLKKKLASLEDAQKKMKAANVALRKNKTDETRLDALIKLGFSESTANGLLEPDYSGRRGFPSYSLTNNNAKIKTTKKRVEALEQEALSEDLTKTYPGFVYKEDTFDARSKFIFEDKPSEAIRKILKTNGFRWSPTNSAWMRLLNNRSRYIAKSITDEIIEELK